MANEQAANRAKRAGKINFYKFVGKVEDSKGVLMSVGNDKIVTAMNGIGGTLNGIARLLEDYTKLAASNFLKEQKNKTAARRVQNDEKKPGKKLGGAGVVGAFGSVVAGAFAGFLSLFSGLLKFFIVLPLLNWISNPANKEKLAKIIEGIIGVAKFLADLVGGAVMVTLELIAGFTKLPFWKEILKFGLFLAALGTSFLAFKKLFGGKAAKWVVKTVFSLFKGFFKALVDFSGKLMKFMARRGLRGARGLLKGGKGFLKSKGGKLAAGAAIAVGTSFALDRAADSLMGQEYDEADKELSDQEKDTESELSKQIGELGAQITKAQVTMEAAEKPAAKELAEPSTKGGPQPATESTPTNVGSPQPAPTSGQSAGGLQPAAPPAGQSSAPTGSPTMPMASLGGLIRLKKRAEGGAVVGGQKPATPSPSQPPKVKSKPLNQLSKFIGKRKDIIDESAYAKQAKLLPKLFRAPMKMVGLATMGIISNIVKVLSKIPGAGLLVGTIENLITPLASAFGLKGNVVSKMRGAGIVQAKEVEKKQQKKSQQQQQKQAAEQKQEIEAVVESKTDKGFFGKAADGVKGFLGKLIGRSGGGWIDGPQTGYPVSLDGGKSVSFIGHGREYVATKSNGGTARSAFVIPYDTPATRGNKNLTSRREKEARSAGFKFAGGGAVRMLNQGKPKLTKQQLLDMPVEEGKGEAKSPNEGGWNKFAAGGALKRFAAGGLQNGRLPDSELVSIGSGHRLHKSVASQFLALKAAAQKDGFAFGSQLRINSSYRSLQRQKELYAQLGPGTAAYPGTSNHGWGKAVDLWYTNAAYKWLRKNASKFGFRQIPGYETDNPDGHEAWHWENVSGAGVKSASGVKTDTAKGGDKPSGGGLDEAARAGGGGEAKTAAEEETPEQKTERLKGMLNTAFGKIAGLAGTSIFSTATGGTDDYNAIVSKYGGGSGTEETPPIQLDPSTIKPVQPGEKNDIKATSGISEAQNNNVKGATESVEQVKAKVADEKKLASKELTQKVVTQNLSAQAQINSIQSQQKNSGKSGNTIDIPLTGGGSSEPDDIILYRPGFGLFSGVMNAGGSGL